MSNNTITPQDVKKENFRMALQVWLRTVLSTVLSLFVYMSISVIFQGVFTHEIGYQIYELNSSGERVVLEKHLYEDEPSAPASSAAPAGPQQPGPEQEGEKSTAAATQTTLPSGQYKETIRSDVPAAALATANVLSSVCMLLLLAAFPYSIVWTKGDRDKNNVNFGHMQEDKLRGLKVGAIAGIPSALLYVVLLLSKCGVFWPNYIVVYRLLNLPFLPIINAMTGLAVSVTAKASWLAVLGMLITVLYVPLVCHFGYVLGYKQIALAEKFVYVNPNKKKRRR